MKNILIIFILIFSVALSGQKKRISKKSMVKKAFVSKQLTLKANPDLIKINDSVSALIPKKMHLSA